MNRTILTVSLALVLVLASGKVYAQMDGPGMMGEQEQSTKAEAPPPDYPDVAYPGMMGDYGDDMGPAMMGEYGDGMGPGMRGGYGYGTGPGMRGGYGYGMGRGMRGGYGYGMGPGMRGGYGYGWEPGMGRGCGTGPGVMRGYGDWGGPCYRCYGYGHRHRSFVSRKKFQKFLDDTRDLRKKLNGLRFDYREMARNPKADEKQMDKLEKEIFDLQQQIREKAEKE